MISLICLNTRRYSRTRRCSSCCTETSLGTRCTEVPHGSRPSSSLVPPTRTLASVRFVHTAISSLVLISGYRFLWKVASSSCSCWLVKWVRCRRCFFFFGSSAFPSSLLCSAFLSFSVDHKSNTNVPSPVGNWYFYTEMYKCNVSNGKRFVQNLKSDKSGTTRKTVNTRSKMQPRRDDWESYFLLHQWKSFA